MASGLGHNRKRHSHGQFGGRSLSTFSQSGIGYMGGLDRNGFWKMRILDRLGRNTTGTTKTYYGRW
jgi:hypothetical protein